MRPIFTFTLLVFLSLLLTFANLSYANALQVSQKSNEVKTPKKITCDLKVNRQDWVTYQTFPIQGESGRIRCLYSDSNKIEKAVCMDKALQMAVANANVNCLTRKPESSQDKIGNCNVYKNAAYCKYKHISSEWDKVNGYYESYNTAECSAKGTGNFQKFVELDDKEFKKRKCEKYENCKEKLFNEGDPSTEEYINQMKAIVALSGIEGC